MKGLALVLGGVWFCAGCAFAQEDPFQDGAAKSVLQFGSLDTPHVDVECAFIELNDPKARPLLSDGLSAKMLLGLVKSGDATVLSAPMVRTLSRQDAEWGATEEVIYPSEFDVTPVSSQHVSEEKRFESKGVFVEPGSFETREVGAILNVLAVVSDDRKEVLLAMSPELVLPPVWKDYGSELKITGGVHARTVIEQPFFRTMRFQAKLVLTDGESVLVGGGALNVASERPVYAVVTAKIVARRGGAVVSSEADSDQEK